MPTLGEYTNVYDTALTLLSRKGYQLWHDAKTNMYCAERDGWDFMAENPVSLAGLVLIYETLRPEAHREYWWRVEEVDFTSLPSAPSPFVSVLPRRGPKPPP